jgi:DNA-binding transcriptional MerR regulator
MARAMATTHRSSLTIEQLAAASGMTVRNIRAHRARGLLPPPEVRERVGYYGPEHLARLRLIAEMQADGFNLRAIARLLEETHGPPEQLLSLKQAVVAPIENEQPRVFTTAELQERFGDQADRKTLALAARVGLLIQLDEDRYEAPVPSLLDAAEEVVARGVPLAHTLALDVKVREHCRAVAREFVELFLDDLWKPFADAGYPEERWSEVTESIERLRPLSARVLLAAYQLTMSHEVEDAFGRELERLTKRGGRAEGGSGRREAKNEAGRGASKR